MHPCAPRKINKRAGPAGGALWTAEGLDGRPATRQAKVKKNREALHQDMVARKGSLNMTKSGASAREYPLFQMPETAPKRSTWVENVRNGASVGLF